MVELDPSLQPHPQEWLCRERLQCMSASLGSAFPSLAVSGLLRQALEGWVRQQLANDAGWSDAERVAFAEGRRESYLAKRQPGKFGLTDATLLQHLSTAEGCLRWTQRHWHGALQRLYLASKSRLDQASCRLLRVSSEPFALELYYRIHSGEASFAQLASQFSEGPERSSGGEFPLQPLSQLPMGLGVVLPELKPGELTTPRALGSQWALVQLDTLVPARFDDPLVQERLLTDQLHSWLSEVVNLSIAHLALNEHDQNHSSTIASAHS